MVLPALEVTGLLDIFDDVYGRDRAALYSARALVLSLVFAALLGEPRVEGFNLVNPTDVGRLIGLDRAPEPERSLGPHRRAAPPRIVRGR